jgi:DNA polymerase-1
MKDSIIDLQSFKEKFGIEPHQMIDVQGLSGDTADNIPGVPGIGQKTALSLVKPMAACSRYTKNLTPSPKKNSVKILKILKTRLF